MKNMIAILGITLFAKTALIIISAVFAFSVFALAIKLIVLKTGIKEINRQIPELIKGDTNATINISSFDKDLKSLANVLNAQLRLLREKELTYLNGDSELKSAITNVAHDIRTPLTAICGYLEMIKEEKNPDKIEKYIEIMTQRATSLKTLSEELFGYSIATDHDRSDKPEKVNVSLLLQDTLFSFYTKLSERNIVPQINMSGAPLLRFTDKNSLTRIFSNVIDNAIKYSDGDFSVSVNENGIIEFSNTASNLDNLRVQKLFDRFYTVENCNYSTGLGLSIAKLLTKRLGGEITAQFEDKVLKIILKI
ncbi:MAG: HAMP domain-containing histidine kinase [Clostridia bacterium]|nr:HAMP domain-containing histidine kinase [Clostridia bacterium]